jgi:ribosomal protein L37E
MSKPKKKKFTLDQVPSKNKGVETARQLDATIPGRDKKAFTCPKCGRDSYHPKDKEERYCGACGFVGDAFKCVLCEKKIEEKDVANQFCHGCKKLICDDHLGDTAFGSHAVEDHDAEPEDAEFDDE